MTTPELAKLAGETQNSGPILTENQGSWQDLPLVFQRDVSTASRQRLERRMSSNSDHTCNLDKILQGRITSEKSINEVYAAAKL